MRFSKFQLFLVGAIAVIYLFSAKGYLEIIDTSFSVETACALYDHGSFVITDPGEGAVRAADGRLYSKYGVGLPFSFLPYVAAGTMLSHVAKMPRADLIAFLISFANIPFGVVTLLAFVRLLKKFAISERTTGFLIVALGLGTLCWCYAAYDFSEEIQVALMMIAVQGTIRAEKRDALWAGMAFGALLFFKLVHLALLPVFGLYLLVAYRDSVRVRRVVEFAAPVLIALAVIGTLNAVRFGHPLESGYGGEMHKFELASAGATLGSLLVSLDKGLLPFCPVLLLGLVGWRWFWVRQRPEAIFCLALVAVNLAWASAWNAGDAGWSWGPRLLVPTLPLWLLPAAFFLDAPAAARWRPAFVVLLATSIVWQFPGVLVKDQEIHQVRDVMATADEARELPPTLVMATQLLLHKISGADEIYHLSDFNRQAAADQRVFDLTSFHTFHGLNVWSEQMSRQLRKPVIRLLPLAGVLIAGGLFFAAFRVRPLA